LDRAVALKPGDSILLSNAAENALSAAVRDLAGSAIDLKALRRGGRPDGLGDLYQDPAGRRKQRGRPRRHPGVGQAGGYLERVLVLKPQGSFAYGYLSRLYALTRDVEGLKRLAGRLGEVELDNADSVRQTLDYFTGKNDDKWLKGLRSGIERDRGVLQAVRKSGNAVTRAAAAAFLARDLMSLDLAGQKVDADEVVRLAEEAHAAAPSRATLGTLTGALLARGSRTL